MLCDEALRPAQVDNGETIVDSDLAKHSVNVILDCLLGNVELLRNLFISETSPNHFDELLLAASEPQLLLHTIIRQQSALLTDVIEQVKTK